MSEYEIAGTMSAAEAMPEASLTDAVSHLVAEVRRQREEIRKLQTAVEELMMRTDPQNISRALGTMLSPKR